MDKELEKAYQRHVGFGGSYDEAKSCAHQIFQDGWQARAALNNPASLSLTAPSNGVVALDDAQIASMAQHAAPVDAQDGGGNTAQAVEGEQLTEPQGDGAKRNACDSLRRPDAEGMPAGEQPASPNPFAEALAQMQPVRVMTVEEIAELVYDSVCAHQNDELGERCMIAATLIASLGAIRVEG